MRSRGTTAKVAYGVLAVTDTVLAGRGTKTARRLRYLTKPLLMPALATAFASSTADRRDVMRQATLGAQAFSWVGDLALLGSSKRAFLTGVGSFFAAHVGYISGFVSSGRGGALPPGAVSLTGPKTAAALWAAATPPMTFAAGRKDPALRVPIAAYSTALAAMFATSTLLDQGAPSSARRTVVLGTTLFLLSDTILAVREFVLDEGDHSPAFEAAVMATYTAGQWFIAEGVAKATTR